MLIEMKISGLTVDNYTNMPIVILKDAEGKHSLPIWIGILEASAIATELEQIVLSRPMTHDLLKNILDTLNARVDRIVINDLRDNTFYANIHLVVDGREVLIDARPSDSLAIALRTGAPIWVDSTVIEKSQRLDLSGDKSGSDPNKDKFSEILEKLSPKDFGKYKM